MINKYIVIGLVLISPAIMGASECDGPRQDTKQTEADKSRAAANSIQFTENAERENIVSRLKLTANPGLLGFIVLQNEMGQALLYEGVKGKITSGSKRLTKPQHFDCWNSGCASVPAPSDEGTFGTSGEYVYYWNTQGAYRQWNGKYFYSDKPFRLSTPPLVLSHEYEEQNKK